MRVILLIHIYDWIIINNKVRKVRLDRIESSKVMQKGYRIRKKESTQKSKSKKIKKMLTY